MIHYKKMIADPYWRGISRRTLRTISNSWRMYPYEVFKLIISSMKNSNDPYIDYKYFEVDFIKGETIKAYLIKSKRGGSRWVPKSTLTFIGETGWVRMPQWFYKKLNK
jgi:hypothetical protein